MPIERVQIEPAARAAISGHARSKPNAETGGILLGRRLDEATVRITRASPPGPRARHGRFFFSRDTAFLQRYLDGIHDRSNGREDYVGEWHVHLALNAPPSCVDRRSLYRIARATNYGTANPVLLIAEHSAAILQLRGYGFRVRPKAMNDLELMGASREASPRGAEDRGVES
ncbi:MAG: Mov34/MPN/PAD-1 family protein [Solirubrobacterales bacterium]